MKYRADIEGIRAAAVLLVLTFHFDLFVFGTAGFVGVDVFFVISGFLITTIIRRDLEAGQFHFGQFLYRRVRRLYPALMATILLSLLAGWVLLLPYRFEELAVQTLWSLLYVVNFYFWQSINYFGLQADSVPLLHLWSLAIEEQFYVTFPLVCMAIWRIAPRLLLPLVLLGLLGSFALALVFAPAKPEAAFYLLPTRAWELLMGSALALSMYGRQLQGRWLRLMGPAGLALIAACPILYTPLTIVPGWFLLFPTVGTVFLIIGGNADTAPTTRFFENRIMVWIGKISYPLYLVHWPIQVFLREHVLEPTLGWRICGFVLSFVVAAGIYYLVDRPARRNRISTSPSGYLGSVALLSVAMVGASWAIIQTGGVPARFSQEVMDALAFRNDKAAELQHCETLGPTVNDMCGLGAAGAKREVLVIGDSHAVALSGALDLLFKEEGRGAALGFHHDCMPVLGAGNARCQQAAEDAVAFAERSPGIREVVLVSIWRQALAEGGKQFDDRWVPKKEVWEVFAAHLAETVERFEAAGKTVTVIEPMFAALRRVPDTLAANIAYGRAWPLDRQLDDHLSTFAPIYAALDRLETIRRLSVIEPFCKDGICHATMEGKPVFVDNNHLAFGQSKRIADWLAAN